ncbi:hypothetical protein FDZ73_18090 [bacterium]|nr:MAG: hypothetical protein FDZ73_18090 [bacterium]
MPTRRRANNKVAADGARTRIDSAAATRRPSRFRPSCAGMHFPGTMGLAQGKPPIHRHGLPLRAQVAPVEHACLVPGQARSHRPPLAGGQLLPHAGGNLPEQDGLAALGQGQVHGLGAFLARRALGDAPLFQDAQAALATLGIGDAQLNLALAVLPDQADHVAVIAQAHVERQGIVHIVHIGRPRALGNGDGLIFTHPAAQWQ